MTTQKWKYSGALWFSVSVHMFDKSYKPKRVVSTSASWKGACVITWGPDTTVSFPCSFCFESQNGTGGDEAKPSLFCLFLGRALKDAQRAHFGCTTLLALHPCHCSEKWGTASHHVGEQSQPQPLDTACYSQMPWCLAASSAVLKKVAQRSTTGWNLLIFGP